MNRSVIVVGITLIWQNALAGIHIKLYWRYLNLAGERKIAKLKLPPNKLRIYTVSYAATIGRSLFYFILILLAVVHTRFISFMQHIWNQHLR